MDGNGTEILGRSGETNDVCDVLSFIMSDSSRMSDIRELEVRKNVSRALVTRAYREFTVSFSPFPFYSLVRDSLLYAPSREPFI